jgi:uncharacterized protein (TIGR03437 family)
VRRTESHKEAIVHKCFARLLAVSLFSTVVALAQPVISIPALSSASYRAPGMPGSGIAQGSIFSIFGTGLGPGAGVGANAFPLPTALGGASATVTVGGTQVSAIILYTSSFQVNAILPSTTPVGSGTFTVTYNGQTSAPAAIEVVTSAFGIYTFSSRGNGQAIATDVDYKVNSIIHTFHPGDYATLWGTGLGAINASDAKAPPVGNVPGSITVYVGNTAASVVTYHGRSGFSGLDQIDFQIPAGVTGCYVPIAVEAGGVLGNIGNIATIAVSDSGQTCSDSVMGQDLVDKLAAGQTVDFGYIRLESSFERTELFEFFTGDAAMATFSEYTPGTAGLAEYGVSSGYCVAVDCSYNCGVDSYNETLSDSSPARLDAGALSVLRGTSIPLSTTQYLGNGYYYAVLTGPSGEAYLLPGLPYLVSGTGGAAVGAFSVSDLTSVPSSLALFTGLTADQTVPLSGDLTVQWSGGDPTLQNGQVTIGALSANSTFTLAEFLQCTAPASAQKFTIPGWVLSALPPTGTFQSGTTTYALGWIWIGQYNKPTSFSATGLDSGIVTDISNNGFGVYFK